MVCLIPSSSMSFRLLNREAWSRLVEFSLSSMVIVPAVGLASLVVDLTLVWECILVMRVVWEVEGFVWVSKICPSGVLGLFDGG